jgi:hypothetical protein
VLVTILSYRDGGISPGQRTQPPALCTFFLALMHWAAGVDVGADL